ncbi:hypothetical protein KJ068_08710 [bacterium]|nr:hypothetical protein [bacterium]
MTALNSGLFKIAALALFACNCGYYQTKYVYRQVERQVEPRHTPQRLTCEMIRYFGISREELRKLEFRLENALILQEVRHGGESTVTSTRKLDLKRTVVQDEIVFPHFTWGQPIDVLYDWSPWCRWPTFAIWVQFEAPDGRNPSLTKKLSLKFTPNFCGEYEVDKTFWTNKVSYQGRWYQSLLSGVDNFLLVDTDLLEEIIHRRRIVTGIKYRQ